MVRLRAYALRPDAGLGWSNERGVILAVILLMRLSIAGMFLVVVPALLGGCNRPFHLWEAHTTATQVPPSLVVSLLSQSQTAILLPATYNHLQGYLPALSQALTVACGQTSPAIPVLAQYETVNRINAPGMVLDYVEQDPSFAASPFLSHDRLQKIRETLGVRYVLQPGLIYVTDNMDDKFELMGWHILRSRVNTLGLWLRLWDAQTGEFLWESAGESDRGG